MATEKTTNIMVLFPNQLFKEHPAIDQASHILLVEEPRFFYDFEYCKQKLVLHRASMQAYRKHLIGKGKIVRYVNFQSAAQPGFIEDFLADKQFEKVGMFDPEDIILERLIDSLADKYNIQADIYDNPLFMTSKSLLWEFFSDKRNFLMASFYKHQRKQFNILLDEKQRPVGGKWSFDKENRKKITKDIPVPTVKRIRDNEYVAEAKQYVNTYFPHNPGSVDDFNYPVTYLQAEECFDDFLRMRFDKFGDYEDAISADNAFLFHSMLSPSLNIGLIEPEHVIKKAVEYAEKNNIAINNVEGFVRQVLGWREFMHAIYIFKESDIRLKNFWKFNKKMPLAFYEANTGIEPVDNVIKRVYKFSYAHHIERLMVIGSFMLLCEIHPDYVYKWFMEMFIDAYDWVMVSNVYGMSQYAGGAAVTTKPYLCSSNYILKMSDYKAGPWCEIWDGLYWRFIDKHRKMFNKNARMRVMISLIEKMDKEKLQHHIEIANKFLDKLFSTT